MQLRVLGSAAGGGFPQWNCNCPNCDGFRRGTLQARACIQSSIAVSALVQATAWTRAEFEARLHAQGAGHHIHHPFNARMNSGQCPPEEIRHWIRNRFCHQICIPRKDAAILANMPGREHRRLWIERILGHDGYGDYTGSAAGGIEAWTRLGEAVGIPRDELWSLQGVAPAVRFACDSYVNFCCQRALAGSGVLVAHRDVRAANPQGPPGRRCQRTIRGSMQRGWLTSGAAFRWRAGTWRTGCRSRWSTSPPAPRSTGRWTFCSSSSTSCGPCSTPSKRSASMTLHHPQQARD